MEEIIKLAEKGNFQVRHFETWQEYMEDSAKRLFQNGNVTDGFLTALVEREKKVSNRVTDDEYCGSITTCRISICKDRIN